MHQNAQAPAAGQRRSWHEVLGSMKVQRTLTICCFLAIPLVLLVLFLIIWVRLFWEEDDI